MTNRKSPRIARRSDLTLKALLEEAVTRYGTQDLAADAIGVNSSRVNKILRSETRAESLAVTNCLKLARALGRSPSEVLKGAGKADAADLIEELYGPEREPQKPVHPNLLMEVSPDERDVVEALRVVKNGRPNGKPQKS